VVQIMLYCIGHSCPDEHIECGAKLLILSAKDGPGSEGSAKPLTQMVWAQDHYQFFVLNC